MLIQHLPSSADHPCMHFPPSHFPFSLRLYQIRDSTHELRRYFQIPRIHQSTTLIPYSSHGPIHSLPHSLFPVFPSTDPVQWRNCERGGTFEIIQHTPQLFSCCPVTYLHPIFSMHRPSFHPTRVCANVALESWVKAYRPSITYASQLPPSSLDTVPHSGDYPHIHSPPF